MNTPNMISVVSTDLASVGHDGQNLFIRFNSGPTYIYSNVPESIFRELLVAPSKGKYFHRFIKNAYTGHRI